MALIEKLKAIANAIRSKTNKTEELTLEQMASAIEELKVGELDFSELGWNESNSIIQNSILKDEITKAIERGKLWTGTATSSTFWGGNRTGRMFYYYTKLNCPNLTTLNLFSHCHAMSYINIDDAVENCNNLTSCNTAFQNDYMLREVNLGHIDYSKVTTATNMFTNCCNIKKIYWGNFKDAKLLSMVHMFTDSCFNIETMDFSNITTQYCENMNNMFYYSGGGFPLKTKSIIGLDMTSCTTASDIFKNRISILEIEITNWGKCNLSLNTQASLSSSSIHYIIQNAMNVVDGAMEGRILTLHATAKTNWQNSEYYEQDLAVLEQKGITIA